MECPTCESLLALGVRPWEPDLSPWIDSPPAGIDALEVFGPGQGHADTVQIRRCKECGTLYRYRYHNEYDVSGSWEEYYFWRLGPESQSLIGQLLTQAPEARLAPLAQALQHAQVDVREDAALLLWITLDAGSPVDEPLLEAACLGLLDEGYQAGNFCYRALLGYIYRGFEEASTLKATLERLNLPKRETRFSWILIKDAEKVISA